MAFVIEGHFTDGVKYFCKNCKGWADCVENATQYATVAEAEPYTRTLQKMGLAIVWFPDWIFCKPRKRDDSVMIGIYKEGLSKTMGTYPNE